MHAFVHVRRWLNAQRPKWRRVGRILWARWRCNWRILTKMEGCELICTDARNRIIVVALVKSDCFNITAEGMVSLKPESVIAVYYEEPSL